MASYIEFVGVPGVGKTTMYKYLGKKYSKDAGWILYEELCRNKYNYKSQVGQFMRWHLQRIRKPGSIPRIPHNRQTLIRFIDSYPELLGSFWEVIKENVSMEDKDLRMYKINYIRDVMEKIQNVKDEISSQYCLVDEGLIHNLNYFSASSSKLIFKDKVSKILDSMPLPEGVIYLHTDMETVIDRTLRRACMRPGDKFLTVKELIQSRTEAMREKEMFIEEVQAKGIPVLSLDTRDPLETNFDQIAQFISSHSDKKTFSSLEKRKQESLNTCKVESDRS